MSKKKQEVQEGSADDSEAAGSAAASRTSAISAQELEQLSRDPVHDELVDIQKQLTHLHTELRGHEKDE